MDRGILVRWTLAARRVVPNWLLALIFNRSCKTIVYKIPEDDGRAERIGTLCPDGVCEFVSVGKNGSPGKVAIGEKLHRIIIAPTDFDKTALAISIITQAERKGMSVLRESATDNEFKSVVAARIKKPNQSYYGVATIPCGDLRRLIAQDSTEQRKRGDRIYYVLDTDMEGLPHHADIFATVPRAAENLTHKAAWRTERERLLNLMVNSILTPAEFRQGATA